MVEVQDRDGLTRAVAVALRELAGEGCFGTRALRSDYISVAASKRGITLAVGHIKAAVCERIVASGWAEWRGSPDHARLVLNDVGRLVARKVMERLPKEVSDDIEIEERVVGNATQAVMVDRRESPLAWLARRKGADGKPLIDPACFAAGERLRADFERTGLSPRVTVDWGRFGAGSSSSRSGGGSLSDAMISARQRMEQALQAVGADMAGLLVDICCYLKGLDLVERERGWPPRSAKLVLSMALGRLAVHYGIGQEARGREHSKGIVVWADGETK